MAKKEKVTKEFILEITKGGILFYLKVIKGLEVGGDKCKNVLNPFYEDKKPSLSIYFKDEQWYFKDHGDSEFSGDVFQFAATFFDLDSQDDFPEILQRMYELDYSKIPFNSEMVSHSKSKEINKPYELLTRKGNRLEVHEIEYFKQYGITKEILKEYNVSIIDGAFGTKSNGKSYSYERKMDKQILIAYQHEGGAKIYIPEPKDFGHVGNKPSDFVFGEKQIENHEHNVIIITGGEKDVLTLAGLGYAGVCLNSESAKGFPANFLKYYGELDYTFLILYDNDSTGVKQGNALSEKYGFKQIYIPSKILESGGKDISDYVKNGLKKKFFDKLVSKSLKEVQEEANVIEGETADIEETIKSEETELLPLEIFPELPDFLRKCCNVFEDQQDKSLVLLSSIALLGGVFRNVTGRYYIDTVGTNLYLFTVAPASSGKGIMKYPKLLGGKIHKTLKEVSLNKDSEGDTVLELFFIPANSSSSSILSQLSNNNGYGMIWEHEADTLADTLSKEWGNFSDALRKAFHHEYISYQRKTNNEHFEIENPNLGLVLSGTPNQVNSLIKSAENGLFSRMLFFDFKAKNKWNKKLHLAQQNFDMTKYFNELGEEVYEFFDKLMDLDKDIDFDFTSDQWEIFHEYFDGWFNNSLGLFGEEILASIKRLGLITFKIAMILSACRLMDEEELPHTIYCSDEDFETSIKIASCCKSHMISVYSRLTTKDIGSRLSNLQQVNYFEYLPDTFSKAMSREIADLMDLKHKTAENYIELYIEKKLLVRYSHGKYRKLI